MLIPAHPDQVHCLCSSSPASPLALSPVVMSGIGERRGLGSVNAPVSERSTFHDITQTSLAHPEEVHCLCRSPTAFPPALVMSSIDERRGLGSVNALMSERSTLIYENHRQVWFTVPATR